jgi:hypothetical protein
MKSAALGIAVLLAAELHAIDMNLNLASSSAI